MREKRALRSGGLGLVVAGLFALASAASGTPADAPQVSPADDPSRPFVVKIHADWCGTCVSLDPTIEALQESQGTRARIVVLDVTDRETLARASTEADRLRLRAFFDQYKAKTGTVGVLHGATREPVSVFKGELDAAKYEAAIARAASGTAS
jgi:thiol-disulfide isomerase/thioredoxin